MKFRIILFIFLILYIFSGVFFEYFSSKDSLSSNEILKELIIDENQLNVFEKKSLDNINVTEKRIKSWIVIINYNETNKGKMSILLNKSGYKIQDNLKKTYFSIGPFADISHAKDEAKKLKTLYGVNSKIIDFVF